MSLSYVPVSSLHQPQTKDEKEVANIQDSIHGLADNINLLAKKGRRFLLRDELSRLKKGGSTKNTCVFLFNDVMVLTEKSSRKKETIKYVTHMFFKDILFIDADSKDKPFSFGIYHKESKKKTKFIAKNSTQKSIWKQHIETQSEKHCPTADSFDGESYAMGSPSRDAIDVHSMEYTFGSFESSHSDFGESGDDKSLTGESPPCYPPLSDCSSTGSADDESCDTESTRSDNDDSCSELDCKLNVLADGTELLSYANLHTIAWWLISYGDFNDPILIKTFLHTFINVATAEELFDNLTNKIYNLACPPPKAISLRLSLCDVQRRVTYFLHIWIEHFFERDFYPNVKLFIELLAFFDTLRQDDRINEANKLKLVIIRVNKKRLMDKGMNRFHLLYTNSSNPGTPTSKALSTRSGQHPVVPLLNPSAQETKFLDWNINTVAEQFVLIEFGLFKAVELKEISNLAWKSEHPRKTSPNVVNMFNRFDLVSQWAATEVVMAQSPKQRVTVIEKLIQLAQKCLDLRNYNSLMEIIAGLNRGSVQRMRKAWECVAHQSRETFKMLNSVVDSLQNYKNYREQLKRTILPCLPYFGIFLRDLTFTDVGNQSKIGENINFEKIYMTSRILKDVQMFQRTSYAFEDDETLQPLVRRLLAMPEELLYKQSQTIEPTLSSSAHVPLAVSI